MLGTLKGRQRLAQETEMLAEVILTQNTCLRMRQAWPSLLRFQCEGTRDRVNYDIT